MVLRPVEVVVVDFLNVFANSFCLRCSLSCWNELDQEVVRWRWGKEVKRAEFTSFGFGLAEGFHLCCLASSRCRASFSRAAATTRECLDPRGGRDLQSRSGRMAANLAGNIYRTREASRAYARNGGSGFAQEPL